MQCPYLKKVNFERIVPIGQIDEIEAIDFSSSHAQVLNLEISRFSQQSGILQQAIEQKHNDTNRVSLQLYQFNECHSNLSARIKFPRQMQIKKIKNSNLNVPFQFQIPQQISLEQAPISPHILISKTNVLSARQVQEFYGENICSCKLQSNILNIAHNLNIKCFVNFQKTRCLIEATSQKKVNLKLVGKKSQKQIKLRFLTDKQRQLFLIVLVRTIQKIEKQKKSNLLIHKLLNEEEEEDSLVFTTERISFKILLQNSNTFDILLFKNKSLISCVQRVLTNSSYDHTALLLRTVNDQILILEATSNMGVAVFPLKSLLTVFQHHHFSRIGLRKYIGPRTFLQIIQLQKFVKRVVGMPYHFDPMYLLGSEIDKKNTYFCSQLIADALQTVQIMSKKNHPFKYLPKHIGADNLNQDIVEGQYSEIIIVQ